MTARPAAKSRPPLSITLRLALLFSAVAVVTFVGVGAYLYQTLARQMSYRDDAELIGKIALIRHILGEAPSIAEIERAPHPLLDTVFGHDDFVLRLTGPDQKVLVQSVAAAMPVLPPAVVPADREPVIGDVQDWTPAAGSGRMVSAIGMVGGAHGQPLQITIARQRSDRLLILKRYAIDLLIAVCAGAAMATAFGFLIVRQGMMPLRSVIGKANDISTHRLNSRLSVQDAPAELQELGSAFNAMLDRLEDGVQRLSGFAADLAHDLRTPINTLMVETQVALSRPRSVEEYQTLLASNSEEYERLARMIENTLFLARVDNAQLGLQREQLDAHAELRRIGDYFEGLAEEAAITLTVDGDAGAIVSADAILLQRAVGNLVSNAIRHTPAGGAVRLTARHGDGDGGIDIVVCNSGPGIAAEHLPHIFDRYYRADPARSASAHSAGLGLSIVRAIMELHGGSIVADSVPGGQTTFRLRFKAAAG
ncbi:heavy metal sensor histidine kinase [Rugamonas sp.]|uniref:heavy metal sensor histidine kinase n=1 Tax=Rugamonas sp. TaxID=1926287 RepID=UPI0025D8F497|nr:heavy metal sensor histidine kinase [Rugamonas sp.]